MRTFDETRGTAAVPKRAQIQTKYQWNLNDLYENDASFKKAASEFAVELPKLPAFQGRLADAATVLADCLKLRDKLCIAAGRLYAYARMHRDSDAGDNAYQAMTSQMDSLLAKFAAASAFIEPEILAIKEDILLKWLETEPRLNDYRHFMENLLRLRRHVLSPQEEALLAGMAEIRQAPATIYTMLTNADLKFPLTPSESGEEIELTEGRYAALIRSRNRTIRKAAFKNLFSTYEKFRSTFAATYAAALKSAAFVARVKKYPSALEAALEAHHIPLAVYEQLIAATHRHLAPLHRYIECKRKALQLEKIHMYDLYVPLSSQSPKQYSYEDGLQLIFAALRPLGKAYLRDVKQCVTGGWIDVYENQGKRTGAYSWGVYGVHPFVLLNYDDKYDSVSTLAHELGHSMHSYYSSQKQAYINSEYTIFCAEVASTTNEILLLHHMLEKETDDALRLFFLNQHLEQVRTTVYRQVLFAEFEKLVHAKIENGEALTADALDTIWLDLNKLYYGEQIVVDELVKNEWARIPHFYRPFYVYQYATGYAAASALAERLLHEGEAAQKRYLDYLSSGSSKDSLDLLKAAGVDMTSPQPIETTLDVFSKRLDEMQTLLQ